MLDTWKQRLLNDWNLMRIFRLSLGILVEVEAFKNSELIFGLLGGVLLFQAIYNVGCCGSAGCDVNQVKNKDSSLTTEVKNITFEEIK